MKRVFAQFKFRPILEPASDVCPSLVQDLNITEPSIMADEILRAEPDGVGPTHKNLPPSQSKFRPIVTPSKFNAPASPFFPFPFTFVDFRITFPSTLVSAIFRAKPPGLKKYLVSRNDGRIPVLEAFPTCYIGQFPSLYRSEEHTS